MAISAANLLKLRSNPQSSRLYLLIQQPEIYDADAGTWSGYVWSGTLSGAPGHTNDELSVTSAGGAVLLDGMTVLIDSTKTGGWNRGIFALHGDQTIGAGAETLYIDNSSELSYVQNGDKIVVLDEFRLRPRFPKTTEAAGVLSWYKDWGYYRDSLAADGYTWAQLANSEAVYPPTPIMGPHRVAFIDPDVGSVNIDFDWSDSYTLSPGGTVNAWASAGENGGAGWNSALEDPAAQNYTNLSGMAGYRTTLSVLSDKADPIIEFRRGIRYVFTLRRPEEYQAGTDPTPRAHYVPIVDFEVTNLAGDFQSGSWQSSIRVFGSVASEYTIMPGALCIIFAEDWYAGTKGSLGPVSGAENIVMIGHIGDSTIVQDSETGDVTFDILSLGEQASRRENYPVPITNDDTPTEWTDAQDLTVSRAAWWFTVWHTNMAQVADVYADIQLNGASDTREISGTDFLAGDIFRSSIDSFLSSRVVGRILVDRYDRVAFVINRQVQTVGGATTLFDLATGDWIGQADLRVNEEKPTNIVEAGGVNYNAGVITAYLSIAPGNAAGYTGSNQQSNYLAVSGQAQLNTISGDLYAYHNNPWPELTLQMAGNWRFGDIWPQEYIDVDLVTQRVTFTNTDFLIRGVSFDYDASQGTLMTTYRLEYETDGFDGVTVPILGDLDPTTGTTTTPPEKPGTFGGVCLIATSDGVWITYNLLDETPVWESLNSGLGASGSTARYVFTLVEDPNNPGEWWIGTTDGIYYNDDLLGTGTWVQLLALTDIDTIATVTATDVRGIDFCAMLPGYVAACGKTSGGDMWVIDNQSNGASDDPADWRGRGIGGDTLDGAQSIMVSWHLDAGLTEPRCVAIGIRDEGIIYIEDTQDTSGAWTNYLNSTYEVHAMGLWVSTAYDDNDGLLIRCDTAGSGQIRHISDILDGGAGATSSVGDASMTYGSDNSGVTLWAEPNGTIWYYADDDYIWYTINSGTSWATWGASYSFHVGCADGNRTDSFVVGTFSPSEPGSDVAVYYYNPLVYDWDDKTGNLDDDTVAKQSYRIYLLDV